MSSVDGQGLAGELVYDVEQLDAAQIGGLVELEVERPHIVGATGAQPRGGAVGGETAALGPRCGGRCRPSSRHSHRVRLGWSPAPRGERPHGPCAIPGGMASREVPQMLPETILSRVRRRLGPALGRAVLAHHPTRRSDTPNRTWSRSTAMRRRSGVTIFPRPAP